MKKNFYITTPIYYTNGVPHIGHAYTSLIGEVITNFKKINGYRVKFLTGVDENSQKAVLKAEESGLEIMEYLDKMAEIHKNTWDGLDIPYTDFIRTTESRHHKLVQKVLQKCFDNGDIFSGVYEGLYCVGCESFKKETDLIEKDSTLVCPDHLTQPHKIKENNWFFKLSKYQTWLEEFFFHQKTFVEPDYRFNEIKAFLQRGLEDFSISRETNKFGIPLPFDKEHVTYVWFDALFNYLTVCHYPDRDKTGIKENDIDFFPANLHLVGKEILRFHAIYWPAMLASYFDLGKIGDDGKLHFIQSDLEKLPKKILTNGFLTNDGQKISKSLGNVIDPVEFSNTYSKDVMTLYLLSSFNIGQDGDFSTKQALLNYNSKLGDKLGNLVNRVVVLSLKLGNNPGILNGKIEECENKELISEEFSVKNKDGFWNGKIHYKINKDGFYIFKKDFINSINKYDLKTSLDRTFDFLDDLNNFTTKKEPWTMLKDESKLEEVLQILYTIAEGLRVVGLCLYSFFPDKMIEMFNKLGLDDYKDRLIAGEFEELLQEVVEFRITEKGNNLFDKFEV